MIRKKTADKPYLFWILQGSFWLFLGGAFSVTRHFVPEIQSYSWFAVLFILATGFMISLTLRFIYQNINYSSRSIITIWNSLIFFSILFAVFWYLVTVFVTANIFSGNPISSYFQVHSLSSELRMIFIMAMLLTIWSGTYFFIKFWMEWSAQKAKTEKADHLAQNARLQMLRYQLNPHFLFNALNSIRALIDEDIRNAKNMVTQLSEFLRYSLVGKNSTEVPLIEEVEAIQHYLSIEKQRFEEKLNVEFHIDPLAEDFPVLSFLLHPLAENAVKYGMQTSLLPLSIKICATVDNDVLSLEVSNSGHWWRSVTRDGKKPVSTGTGLENIRQRLENAYTNNHRFEIIDKDSMVTVKIVINKNFRLAHENKIQIAYR